MTGRRPALAAIVGIATLLGLVGGDIAMARSSSSLTVVCSGKPIFTGCRTPQRSVLSLRNEGGDKKRLSWQWLGGNTPLTTYGDPTASSTYVLCLYDESESVAELVMQAQASPGTECRGRDCWRVVPDGFQ